MIIVALVIGAMLQGCDSRNENVENPQSSSPVENNATENNVTANSSTENNTTENNLTENNISESIVIKEMAFEGVNNYCHNEYDWTLAEDDPTMMYVEMGEESENEYQVIFRSYTGAFVYFYVDKSNGSTRMVEYVPNLDVENETGIINLYDYLEKQE